MTRQQKFPDTNTFKFYNANPKGKMTDDCVIRAICTATCKNYYDVLRELISIQVETGYTFTDDRCYEIYLDRIGCRKNKQLRKPDNTKYTGKEFCELVQQQLQAGHKEYQAIIARIGGHHIVAIINGKVNDIWNSTGGCVGNFWM